LEDQLSFDDQEIINISYPKLKKILESLLFVTKKPLTVDDIRKVLRLDREMIERSLHDLIAEYSGKGVIISKIAGGFQMVTSHDNVKYVDRLLNSPIETTLSQAALETLAIVSYKQPITRSEIDNIRGVDSDGVLQTLIERKFVAEIGRGSGIGRPRLYATTVQFLRHFGLKELSDLPSVPPDKIRPSDYSSALPGEKAEAGPEIASAGASVPEKNEVGISSDTDKTADRLFPEAINEPGA